MALPTYILVSGTGGFTAGPVLLDPLQVPFGASVAVEVASGSTLTAGQIQYTLDDVEATNAASFSAQAFNPAQVGWTPIWFNAGATLAASGVVTFSSLGSQAATGGGPFPGPIRAVRVTGTLAGTSPQMMFTVIQGVNQRAG